MLSNMFYFEGTSENLDAIKATTGLSCTEERPVLIGRAFNLILESGRLQLYCDGKLVARTGKVTAKEVYIDEGKNMPFSVKCNDKCVSSPVMVVYTTESGSKYAFVPSYAPLECVS